MKFKFGPVLILFILSLSCTNQNSVKRKGHRNFRSIASSLKTDYTKSQWAISDCHTESEEFCFQHYPFEDLSKSFFQTQEAFHSEEKSVEKKYSQCVVKNTYVCLKNQGLVKEAMLYKKIEGDVDHNNESIYAKLLRYSSEDFEKVWNYVSKVNESTKNYFKKETLNRVGVSFEGRKKTQSEKPFRWEFMTHQDEIAFLCSPAINFVRDISGKNKVVESISLSCENNKQYTGKYLSQDLKIPGYFYGLSSLRNITYSFGFKPNQLMKSYEVLKANPEFSPIKLKTELQGLAFEGVELLLSSDRLSQLSIEDTLNITILIYMASDIYNMRENLAPLNKAIEDLSRRVRRNKYTQRSIGKMLYDLRKSEGFQKFMMNYNYKNAFSFMKIIAESFSGCDSVTNDRHFTPTLAPIGLKGYLSSKILITTYSRDSISQYLKNDSFHVFHPYLKNAKDAKRYLELMDFVLNIDERVQEQCFGQGYEEIYRDLYNLKRTF
jgi:hypothetical protein